MNKNDLFYFGYVASKHGVDNSIKIKADVDDLGHYKNLDAIVCEINKTLIPFPLLKSKIINDKEIIATVEQDFDIKEMIGMQVYLPLSMLPKLNDKQFYFHEIIGYRVYDEKKGSIGVIDKVLDYPHQQIFSIVLERKEILVPIIDEFIVSVDKHKKEIHLKTPDGLIELYLNPKHEEDEEE